MAVRSDAGAAPSNTAARIPKGLNWYLAGNWFREDGWRLDSPSEVRQIFGKARLQPSARRTSRSASHTRTTSSPGNGSTDTRFLARNYRAVNTIPDITWNRSPALTLNVSHSVNSHFTLSGAAYVRYVRADTTNGDLNNDSFTESLYNLSAADIAALNAAGYSGFPDDRQLHHRTVPLLALHRAGTGKERTVRKMYRRFHPNLRQATRLRSIRAGQLERRAQQPDLRRRVGSQRPHLSAGRAIRISQSRRRLHHAYQ